MQLQGEKQILELLELIMVETSANRGRAAVKKNAVPWEEKNDITFAKVDSSIDGIINGSPRVYLFFKQGKFSLAEVAADNCVIHLQSGDVVKALVTYMACYYVFHVGYAQPHQQFHGFLQYALLGDEYTGKKSLSHISFLGNFQREMERKMELKKYKKLAV